MKNSKKFRFFPFVLSCGGLLVLIELLVDLKRIPDFIIPSPSGVLIFLWENATNLFLHHALVTLWETILGFSFALIIGCTLAICMYQFPVFERLFYPFALLSQTIPTIALAPIFILWFGYSIWSKIVLSFLMAFFPIVVGLFDGMKSTSEESLELFYSLGASKWQQLWHLSFPKALPQLMSSLKLAIVYALVGASIGEWIGSAKGLGYYSRRMSGNLNAEGVFAAITLLSCMGIFLFLIISLLERKIIFWQKNKDQKF